jgi:hypothetical protein
MVQTVDREEAEENEDLLTGESLVMSGFSYVKLCLVYS